MPHAVCVGMSNEAQLEEILTGTIKGAQVDAAREFLTAFPSTTHALRALMAAMCELDQIREASLVENILPVLAEIEVESM
jgi:hypothetical protein